MKRSSRLRLCLVVLFLHLMLPERTEQANERLNSRAKEASQGNADKTEDTNSINKLTSNEKENTKSDQVTSTSDNENEISPTDVNNETRKGDIDQYKPEIKDISDLVADDAKYLVKDFDYTLRKVQELIVKNPALQELANSLNIKSDLDYNLSKLIRLLKEAVELNLDSAKLVLAKLYFFGDLVDLDLNEAFKLFNELSKKGYADANLYLGFMHSLGLGPVGSNQAKALLYYTLAAASNSTFAKFALGYRYWLGISVTHNCEYAMAYYREVASRVEKTITFSGNIAIQRIRLLEEIENPGNNNGMLDDDLIQYYQFLADKGDVNAQLGLGKLHYQGGYGVEHDPNRAFHYFKLAAESGNTNAMTFLGKMYLEGNKRVEQDYEMAMKYFKMATEKGNPVGQSGLGIMYFYGYGVRKDYKLAMKYFSQAVLQGWVDGQLYLGIMYLNGYGTERDPKAALKYFTMASQAGHILGFYHLGEMHATGTGTLRSCSTAVELFKSVCEKGPWGVAMMEGHNNYKEGKRTNAFVKYAVLSELGYEAAQTNAAFILDRDEMFDLFPSHEVHSRAFMYWSRAAAQGYSAARVKLGDYYYYGLGTNVDYEQAANQYRIASEQQNNAQALFNLGYMYETGLGLKRDIYLAKRYYDLAAITSVEAQVPVALALVKLFFVFVTDYLQNFHMKDMLTMSAIFDVGSNWDLFFVTLLVILLVTIIYLQRR